MLEVLRFIFSSFWVWGGTCVMLGIIGTTIAHVLGCVAGLIAALIKRIT